MKDGILRALRTLRCLGFADRCRLLFERAAGAAANRRFARENPSFQTPPAGLAFEAYNTTGREWYFESGRRHARMFWHLGSKRQGDGARPVRILEWGCGPGRIIRHLREAAGDRPLTIVGSDVDSDSLAWCRQHLEGIDFRLHGPSPPMPAGDGDFDLVYCYSVFTHLSEERQLEWARELHRLIAPGGLLIATTHGDHYLPRLSRRERMRYEAGEVVIQGGYREGRKWYLALHPPAFVRDCLLRPFGVVEHYPSPGEWSEAQDVWIAAKPSRPG